MSSYLRPRRGKNATAIAQLGANAPLKRGEVFFEVPDAGVGTGLGKIKMGDGSTAYANLPYFLEQLDLDNAKIAFTDSNTPDDNPYTTNTTLATAIAPTASVKTIFTNLKQLLVNHNAQLTQLNNEIGSGSITTKLYTLTTDGMSTVTSPPKPGYLLIAARNTNTNGWTAWNYSFSDTDLSRIIIAFTDYKGSPVGGGKSISLACFYIKNS